MAEVLTVKAVIVCSHASTGKVQVGKGSSALTVGGDAVLTATDVVGKTINGCPVQVTNSTSPCLAAGAMTSTPASHLTVGKAAVLLDTAAGLTDSRPQGTWSVQSSGQSKLTAS
jgi:hypothetical protein